MNLHFIQCPYCSEKYILEIDLKRTRCSEDFVGSYISEICPKCFHRLPIEEYIDEDKVKKD